MVLVRRGDDAERVARRPVAQPHAARFKNDEMVAKAKALQQELRKDWMVEYDDGGAIGRRYRRQDEIGTPFCLTIDHQSLEDRTVTLRDRDSLEQQRVAIDGIAEEIARRVAAPWTTPKL